MVREAGAQTLAAPCKGVCGQLVDLRIEPGFTQQVRRLFRGIQGCTYLTEWAPVMAITAFQILWTDAGNFDSTQAGEDRPSGSPLGGCYVLWLDGEVVMRHFKHLLPPSPETFPLEIRLA